MRWNIHEDLCGSDYFPVILTSNAVEEETGVILKRQTCCPSKFSVPLNWRRRGSCLPRIPPVSLLTYLLKQQTKLYQKHASRKIFPKFHVLMTVVKEQLKKERKLSESFCLIQRWVMFKILNFQKKARHVVKQQKRNSWRHFCNKLNSKTQTQKVWKAIRKIKGKGGCNSVNHLKVNGNLITDKKEVAEVLAKNLSTNSSTENYSDEFQRIKTLKKKTTPRLLFQKWRGVQPTFFSDWIEAIVTESQRFSH